MDLMLIIWREHACFGWSRSMANGGPERVMPWLRSHREHGQHPLGLDSWAWLALSFFSGGLSIFMYVFHIEVFFFSAYRWRKQREVSWINCGGSGLWSQICLFLVVWLQVLVSLSLNMPGLAPVLCDNI